jgi:hypothetical protein
MGRLTDTVRERVTTRARQGPVPDWLPRFSIVVAALAAVVVVVQALFGLFGGGGELEQAAPRQYVPPVSTSTVAGTVTTGPSGGDTAASTTSSLPPGGTVTVVDDQGGMVELDAAAVAVARAAAVAQFTGDASGIPTQGDGVVARRPGASDPTVTTISLRQQQPGRLEFIVGVEPAPRAPGEPVVVVVTFVDGQWRWLIDPFR